VSQAKPLLNSKHIKGLIDPSLGDDYDRGQLGCLVITASLCIEQSPILRPRMREASSIHDITYHHINEKNVTKEMVKRKRKTEKIVQLHERLIIRFFDGYADCHTTKR